jgi:predicted DCC family thiol-disulfide oxidoreductase YuxK
VTRTILLYDEDCGFCRRSVRWVIARTAGRVDPVPVRSPVADELLAGMDPRERLASWHLLTRDGVVRSAEDVVPELLRLMPKWRVLASPAAGLKRPLRWAYRSVARHRHRLSALLDEEACAVAPRTRRAPGAR